MIPGVAASAHQLSPTDIAPLTYWLDATDEATITSSGGAVSTWTDRVSSVAFTQASAGSRPTVGGTLNGRPVVSFTRTSATVGQYLAATGMSLAQPVTVFAVAVLSSYNSTQGYNVFGSSGSFRAVYHIANNSEWSMFAGSALAGGTAGNATMLICAQFNGASSFARLNGTQIMSGNAGSAGISSNFVIGAANTSGNLNPWSGDIGELLVFPSALDSGQCDGVEEYLRSKWTL